MTFSGLGSMRNKRRSVLGIATLEMALVLPLIVVLLFGVIEYGWLFFKNQQIGAVSRTACRYAITPDAKNAEVMKKIDALMLQAGLQSSGYTKTCSNTEGVAPGTFLTVTITAPYSKLKLTGFPLPLPTDLFGVITMAKEGAPPP